MSVLKLNKFRMYAVSDLLYRGLPAQAPPFGRAAARHDPINLALLASCTIFAAMETKILFVCLGNICRSPAADGIMRHIVRERGLGAEVAVDSAGTYAGHTGELPDARMRRAASRRGYELTHRARQIREEDFGKFDMIVVMDDRNYEHVHRLAPSRADAARIFRMREFFSRHPGWDHVPDPYYEGAEGFELVLDMLEDGCEGILAHLGT